MAVAEAGGRERSAFPLQTTICPSISKEFKVMNGAFIVLQIKGLGHYVSPVIGCKVGVHQQGCTAYA
jgi:hypothetical protein